VVGFIHSVVRDLGFPAISLASMFSFSQVLAGHGERALHHNFMTAQNSIAKYVVLIETAPTILATYVWRASRAIITFSRSHQLADSKTYKTIVAIEDVGARRACKEVPSVVSLEEKGMAAGVFSKVGRWRISENAAARK